MPLSPLPDQPYWKPMLSARRPNASVARARARPPRRSAGSATTAPSAGDHPGDEYPDQDRDVEVDSELSGGERPYPGERGLAK